MSRTFGRALIPTSRNLLSLYQKLGPSRHFPLAVGVGIPKQLQITKTFLYDLWWSNATTPSSSKFHVDADGPFTCPIQASTEEIMLVQTLAILGTTPIPLLSQSDLPEQCPSQIAISPSLWPYPHDSYPLWWKTFSTPKAFTYIKITWAFLPMALQAPSVTPGSPLYPWCKPQSPHPSIAS